MGEGCPPDCCLWAETPPNPSALSELEAKHCRWRDSTTSCLCRLLLAVERGQLPTGSCLHPVLLQVGVTLEELLQFSAAPHTVQLIPLSCETSGDSKNSSVEFSTELRRSLLLLARKTRRPHPASASGSWVPSIPRAGRAGRALNSSRGGWIHSTAGSELGYPLCPPAVSHYGMAVPLSACSVEVARLCHLHTGWPCYGSSQQCLDLIPFTDVFLPPP